MGVRANVACATESTRYHHDLAMLLLSRTVRVRSVQALAACLSAATRRGLPLAHTGS